MLDIDSLDAQPQQAAEELRGLTDDVRAREQSKRHTLIGQPRRESPPLEEPVEAAATSSEPDFERFLRYVRSIKR